LLRKDWSGSEMGKVPTAEQLRDRQFEKNRDELELKASEKELQREAEANARKAEREAKKVKVQGGGTVTNTAAPATGPDRSP